MFYVPSFADFSVPLGNVKRKKRGKKEKYLPRQLKN